MDIVRHSGEADMAEHRAIFLCEPGHIKHGGRDALDMRRHSDQGCHRDDAGAADPGDHDVAMTWSKWRIGKLRENRIINRSEEGRVGKESGSTVRTRGSP